MNGWLQLGCIVSALGLCSCSQIQSFDYVDNRETPPGPGLFSDNHTGFSITLDEVSTTKQEDAK